VVLTKREEFEVDFGGAEGCDVVLLDSGYVEG